MNGKGEFTEALEEEAVLREELAAAHTAVADLEEVLAFARDEVARLTAGHRRAKQRLDELSAEEEA